MPITETQTQDTSREQQVSDAIVKLREKGVPDDRIREYLDDKFSTPQEDPATDQEEVTEQPVETPQLTEEEYNTQAKATREGLQAVLGASNPVIAGLPDFLMEPMLAFQQGLFGIGAGVVDFGVQFGAGFDKDFHEAYEKAEPADRLKMWEEYNGAGDALRDVAEGLGKTQGRYGSGSITEEVLAGNIGNAAQLTVNQTAQGIASLTPFLAGPVLGAAILGSSAGGSAFEEDIKTHPDATLNELYTASYSKAGIEFGTELITGGILNKARKLAAGGASRQVVNNFTGKAWKAVVGDTLAEGASEGLADTGGRIVDKLVYGDEIDGREAAVGFIDSAIVGAIIGGKVSTYGQLAVDKSAAKRVVSQILKPQSVKDGDVVRGEKYTENEKLINSEIVKGDGASATIVKQARAENAAIVKEQNEINAAHDAALDNLSKKELKALATAQDAGSKFETASKEKNISEEKKRVLEEKAKEAKQTQEEIYGRARNKAQIEQEILDKANVVQEKIAKDKAALADIKTTEKTQEGPVKQSSKVRKDNLETSIDANERAIKGLEDALQRPGHGRAKFVPGKTDSQLTIDFPDLPKQKSLTKSKTIPVKDAAAGSKAATAAVGKGKDAIVTEDGGEVKVATTPADKEFTKAKTPETKLDAAIASLEAKYNAMPKNGTLYSSLLPIPSRKAFIGAAVDGLKVARSVHKGAKTVQQAINESYDKVKDFISKKDWGNFLREKLFLQRAIAEGSDGKDVNAQKPDTKEGVARVSKQIKEDTTIEKNFNKEFEAAVKLYPATPQEAIADAEKRGIPLTDRISTQEEIKSAISEIKAAARERNPIPRQGIGVLGIEGKAAEALSKKYKPNKFTDKINTQRDGVDLPPLQTNNEIINQLNEEITSGEIAVFKKPSKSGVGLVRASLKARAPGGLRDFKLPRTVGAGSKSTRLGGKKDITPKASALINANKVKQEAYLFDESTYAEILEARLNNRNVQAFNTGKILKNARIEQETNREAQKLLIQEETALNDAKINSRKWRKTISNPGSSIKAKGEAINALHQTYFDFPELVKANTIPVEHLATKFNVTLAPLKPKVVGETLLPGAALTIETSKRFKRELTDRYNSKEELFEDNLEIGLGRVNPDPKSKEYGETYEELLEELTFMATPNSSKLTAGAKNAFTQAFSPKDKAELLRSAHAKATTVQLSDESTLTAKGIQAGTESQGYSRPKSRELIAIETLLADAQSQVVEGGKRLSVTKALNEYANKSLDEITVEELRKVKAKLKEDGFTSPQEELGFIPDTAFKLGRPLNKADGRPDHNARDKYHPRDVRYHQGTYWLRDGALPDKTRELGRSQENKLLRSARYGGSRKGSVFQAGVHPTLAAGGVVTSAKPTQEGSSGKSAIDNKITKKDLAAESESLKEIPIGDVVKYKPASVTFTVNNTRAFIKKENLREKLIGKREFELSTFNSDLALELVEKVDGGEIALNPDLLKGNTIVKDSDGEVVSNEALIKEVEKSHEEAKRVANAVSKLAGSNLNKLDTMLANAEKNLQTTLGESGVYTKSNTKCS